MSLCSCADQDGHVSLIDQNKSILEYDTSLVKENTRLMGENRTFNLAVKIYHRSRNDPQNKYLQNIEWILKCIKENQFWNEALEVHQPGITLCMAIVESGLDPHATDSSGSIYIYQTKKIYIPRLLKELREEGYDLHWDKQDYKDVHFMTALGIEEFREKLFDCNGDIWKAVLRYNGKGKRAEKYCRKVKILYHDLFEKYENIPGN